MATDRVLVSILQSPEPHWRAQTCTLDVVQQLGEPWRLEARAKRRNREVFTQL